jgi:glutamate racemase
MIPSAPMKTKLRSPLAAGLVVLLGGALAALPRPAAPPAGRQAGEAKTAAYRVATFDSGFGGYFTAKAIEKQARDLSADGYGPFQIAHYGDTTNVPYGEKTPDQIATFASAGILAAFRDGARDVYIACNTASTEVDRIREILRAASPAYPNHVHSIIDVSVREVMKTVSAALGSRDTATVAILATPATIKSEAYPRFLARALGVPFVPGTFDKMTQPRWLASKGPTIDSFSYVTELAAGPKKRVVIYQLAPANWVEMIENGAPENEKREAVRRDLEALVGRTKPGARFDVVGEFCTHYPVFDAMIREDLARLGKVADSVPFVVQGPLMGRLFRTQFLQRAPARAAGPVAPPGTPPFYMSGTNIESTRALVGKVFPGDPAPLIAHRDFVMPR